MSAVQRRPRTPGLLFAGIAMALLVLVATLALTSRTPPPPTIAEFAPQAIEQIRDAPSDQAGRLGRPGGAGLGLPAGQTAAPPADLVPIEVPRVRRCVGDPPRQIEDPQSPPCVPYWRGDNGGATATGVTRDEIRVVLPTSQNDNVRRLQRALEAFFNRRFEFYGRTLRVIFGSQGSGSNDPAVQRAEATGHYEQYRPFAAEIYKSALGTAYSNEMARRGVVTLTNAFMNPAEQPTLWKYNMSADVMFANLAEWGCKRLAHQSAVHAGDPGLQGRQRAFGIIFNAGYPEDKTTPNALDRGLTACGAEPAARSVNEVNAADPATTSTVLLRFRQAGVTSIFCLCQLFEYGLLQQIATRQAYAPEWLISTFGWADQNSFVKLGGNAPEQMEHTFGVSFVPRAVGLDREPLTWATRETDPGFVTPDAQAFVFNYYEGYHSLLVIASGIQMAGPRLTQKTFKDALERTIFPNPEHPNRPGKVSFRDGTHAMTIDGTEIWWSNTARSSYTGDGAGTYCYVDGGVRHSLGTWPSGGGAFFVGPCDA